MLCVHILKVKKERKIDKKTKFIKSLINLCMLLMLFVALSSFDYANEIFQDMDLLASKYGSIKKKII